jgi:hypothetical protein
MREIMLGSKHLQDERDHQQRAGHEQDGHERGAGLLQQAGLGVVLDVGGHLSSPFVVRRNINSVSFFAPANVCGSVLAAYQYVFVVSHSNYIIDKQH